MTFDEAFEKLIGHEGGFTRIAEDKGNWTGGQIGKGDLKGTKYGISAAAFPSLDIENLTLAQAKEIYFHSYWQPIMQNYATPDLLKFSLFDWAVNAGVRDAVIGLQSALNVTADGIIGPKTLQALINCDPLKIVNRLSALRLLDYIELRGFSTFGRGWVRRVAENMLEDNL